jgi:hypothetical protein
LATGAPGSLVGKNWNDAMTSFLRYAARSTGLTAADKHAAESVLGRDHRLTRAVSSQHTLALQSTVAGLAVLAGGAGLLLHLGIATLVVVVGTLVAVAFVLAWAVTRSVTRERAQDLIAAGDDSVVVSVLARERRRLASRRERERLARSLEGLYRDALRWYEILPQFRPPNGVAQLRHTGPELEGLARALRRDRVRVQGVALTARFLSNGYESPLYGDELEPLREELNRIRYLLETGDEVARADARPASAAAA